MCWEICAGKQWGCGLIGLTGNVGKSRNAHVADTRRIFTDRSETQFYFKQSDISTLFIAHRSRDHNEMMSGSGVEKCLSTLILHHSNSSFQENFVPFQIIAFKIPAKEAAV